MAYLTAPGPDRKSNSETQLENNQIIMAKTKA